MISLVIPAYNEEAGIADTVRSAALFLNEAFGGGQLIVCDDGSGDGTLDALEGTDADVISLEKNRGKGAALREGIARAEGDLIFFTDADLPYSLEFLQKGAAALQNADIVCGCRTGEGYPLKRRMASVTYNQICRAVLDIGIPDLQCGIKGFTRSVAKRLVPVCRTDGFAFDTELLFLASRMGCSIVPMQVQLCHRADSRVCLAGDGLSMLADVLKIRKRFEAGEYDIYQILKG